MRIPKDKRRKLDNKEEKCIFVDYKDGIKGYKLWNHVTRKIVYNQDMVFREVKNTSRKKDESKKNDKKMVFELKNEGSYSFEEESSKLNDEVELQTPTLRRYDHIRRTVEWYSPPDFHFAFVLSTINDEPRYVKEVVSFEECKLWKNAMVEEMEALEKNETWDLVEFPDGRKHVGSKWVFKKKLKETRKVEKYKARLVEKEYSQVEGIDFGDVFSPIAKLTSIIFLLSLVATFDLELEQMDVKTMFLHGNLDE